MEIKEIQSPTLGNWSRRLAREPLVHFLLLGGLLFGAWFAFNDQPQISDANRIVVDEAQVASIVATFQRTWLRPPTHEELAGLVQGRVREEILYREALALGLDRDDQVIRRRLGQKMEFLNTDLTEPKPPTEAELQAYLDTNTDRFRTSDRLSFTQLYLKEDEQERITALLQRLAGHPPAQFKLGQLGDASLLPATMQQADQMEIERVFGKKFADALSAAPLEQWSGPYASPYGQHLVFVSDRQPAQEPKLSQVGAAVEREWLSEQEREANERFYRDLRKRYIVEVAYPSPHAGEALATVQP